MKEDIKKAGKGSQQCASGSCAESKMPQGARSSERSAQESSKQQWQQQKPEQKR